MGRFKYKNKRRVRIVKALDTDESVEEKST